MARRKHRKPPGKLSTASPRRARVAQPAVIGVCLGLVVLTWMVFGQTVQHEFVRFDDNRYVFENPMVSGGLSMDGIRWAFSRNHASNWHPLTFISHMLDCQLYGLNAGAHHFTNVVLHTIAVLLLFFFLHKATAAVWRSGFVAALFAIHPLHVESVAWVSERKDVLSALFFFLTLTAYLGYVRAPSSRRYLLVAILFACGLMCKPMLVTAPFVLLLLDHWPLQRQAPVRKLIIEKVPLFILSAGSCIATIVAQQRVISGISDLSWPLRLGNAVVSCTTYLWQTFWPVNLTVFYPHPLSGLSPGLIMISLVGLITITLWAVLDRGKRGYVLTGWFWYLGMLIPVLGVVQVGLQGHADRYTYLPQIGFCILLTWSIADLSQKWRYRRQIMSVSGIVVILVLASVAWVQAGYWRNSETLWRHALTVTRNNHVAHSGLAEILLSRNRLHEAITHLQEATAIYDDAEAHNKLGLALLRTGNTRTGVAHWRQALQIDPGNRNARSNLAWVYATAPPASVRNGPLALEFMHDAIQRSSHKNATALRTLAAAYAECGRFDEAIDTAKEAAQLAEAEGNSNLATILRGNITDFELKLPLRDSSLANVEP